MAVPVDTGAITSMVLSPLIWIIVIFFLVFAGLGSLWVRKQKKLCYSCIVVRNTGNGKIDLKTMKAGWFKTNSMLGGLWDYGMEEELRTGGWRCPVDKIQGGSTVDFHEINGKRGLICRRKDDDPKVFSSSYKNGNRKRCTPSVCSVCRSSRRSS